VESLVHPSELSVWHRYLQARRLHKETSRSKSKDWYRPALSLDCQLHFFLEGESITDAYLVTGKAPDRVWQKVSAPLITGSEEELGEYFGEVREILKEKKAASLGVVLHLADEFATSELAPLHEKPESYGELRDILEEDPHKLLQDHSASFEDISYRLFPNPGNDSLNMLGAAITISRRHQDFLKLFRMVGDANKFPVRTMALSAPLVALHHLPQLMDEIPDRPFCLALTYSSFTVLAFFKKGGDLVMLRTVRHHVGGIPPNVSNTIQTMAIALELGEMDVLILSMARSKESITTIPGMESSHTLNWQELPGMNPEVPLEFQASVWESPVEEGGPQGLRGTETFRELEEGQWARQDFLPPTQEEEDLYPSQIEMRAMRIGAIGLRVGGAVLLGMLAWTGIRSFFILRDSAWHVGDSAGMTNYNQILNGKIRSFEGWNTLLADRSKAWVSMELLNRLFPNPRWVMLTDSNYTNRPENIPRQKTLGMIKEWTVKGYATDDALGHLNKLNTREGIREVFDGVYKVTGAEPMRTDLDTRNLVVNLVASENRRYAPEKPGGPETQFPFQFDLTITQRITQDDDIAIPTVAVE